MQLLVKISNLKILVFYWNALIEMSEKMTMQIYAYIIGNYLLETVKNHSDTKEIYDYSVTQRHL